MDEATVVSRLRLRVHTQNPRRRGGARGAECAGGYCVDAQCSSVQGADGAGCAADADCAGGHCFVQGTVYQRFTFAGTGAPADRTCFSEVPGCTDAAASNYDAAANVDDGMCQLHAASCDRHATSADWCTAPGATYTYNEDCDGDGIADPKCVDAATGESGYISAGLGPQSDLTQYAGTEVYHLDDRNMCYKLTIGGTAADAVMIRFNLLSSHLSWCNAGGWLRLGMF